MARRPALLSWSGGKDSALSLYEMRNSRDLKVVSLLTTLTKDYDRISMHGVRKALLDMQASRTGLPVEEIWIRKGATNDEYESQLSKALSRHYSAGVRDVIFGDLFLEDIRKYREEALAAVNMSGVFPIWKKGTKELAAYFIREGFRAILCTVDPRALDRSFCGREFDESLLSDFPESVDPCGENGEFHTFVYGGPIFDRDIEVKRGDVVLRDGFYFADILPR
jgi:uncharacterized protein (TIGR00290 family)